MKKQVFTDAHSGESCVRIDHPSGLPIFVWNKPGYRSSYAVFATRYGSIDTVFRCPGDSADTRVPAGIAHYLEHKLFENEDCSAFARYAATGASANAYTSFDRTAYLFTTSGPVEPPLEILLDFVRKPYFTEETVRKEQGIIGQEIRMCEDQPARQVLFNLLRALYREHPVKIDIAGTVESIAQITPELLYSCYRTFYNLNNMVLVVAGNATPEQVLAVADRLLPPSSGGGERVRRALPEEPAQAVQPYIEQVMPVASPLFYLGYKVLADGRCRTAAELAAADVLLELIAGRSSALYARLMARGLINESFDADLFEGEGYAAYLFGGESADPQAASEAIREEIRRVRRDGIDEAAFAAARNALYGRLLRALDDVENCGDQLIGAYFYQRNPFDLLDAAAGLDIQSVYDALTDGFAEESAALSVIRPGG